MEDRKIMTLKQYLQKYGTPGSVIAKRTGLNYHQVNRLIKLGYTSFEVAAAIEIYTEGQVPCIKMLKKQQLEKLMEHHRKCKEEPGSE